VLRYLEALKEERLHGADKIIINPKNKLRTVDCGQKKGLAKPFGEFGKPLINMRL